MTRTARDDIWATIIKRLVDEGEFMISDLDIPESRKQTVRRVCREMEEMDYLERDNEQSKTWRAGETAELHLNLSMRAQVNAGLDDPVGN